MKPPLKKKESQTSINPTSLAPTPNLSLNIPEEPTKLTIPSNKKEDEDDLIIRPPPRLMSKRPSAEKHDKIEESNFSVGLKSESLSLAP